MLLQGKELLRIAKDVLSEDSEETKKKYPRTPHLPWSEGATDDDIHIKNYDMFLGRDVVVTEKLDGENTTLSFDKVHARSTDSPMSHPSRSLVKSMWAQMRYDIPPNMRIVGENVYAKHSIAYDQLPAFFIVFAIFEGNTCLSWSDTMDWCQLFGFEHVPILYRGPWEESKIMQCYTKQSKCGGIQEGYVVRNEGSFSASQFHKNVAKFVRAGHVGTSDHWMLEKVIPNKLKVQI